MILMEFLFAPTVPSLGSLRLSVSVNSDNVSGGGVLGTETIAACEYLYARELGVIESSENVEVEGLADGAGLLGSVENGDSLDGLGQLGNHILADEGTIQSDLEQTDLLACGVEVVNNFLCAVADGTHRNDHVLCVSSAVVVEGLVVGADLLVDLVHVLDHDFGNSVIVLVAGFSCLEEDIVVLSGTAGNGVLRVEGASAESLYSVPVEHVSEVSIVPLLDLLDFVRGAEAVEEVQEGNSALDRGEVSNGAEIHTFLRIVGAEHRVTCLTAGIDVGVVAEDGKCVAGQRTSGYVDNAGEQLARHFVHVGDHQEQALRSGVGGSERTCRERAVNSTCCAALRLHLSNLNFSSEKVFQTVCRVLVGQVSHYGRRGDGIDSSNIGKRVGNVSDSAVTIHGFHFSCHWFRPPYKSTRLNRGK